MSHLQSRWLAPALLLAGLSCNMYAVDGIVLIDQNRALAGGVTPGDAPGFPVTLSQPGSYRLTGNLTVPDANTTAIQIAANYVTVDLNGFSIIGPTVCTGSPVTSCSPTGTGNGVDGGINITMAVVNGAVHGMGNHGINFGNGLYVYVEKVRADNNGGSGIVGFRGTMSGNTANHNGNDGIEGANCTVSGNSTSTNRRYGIEIGCPSSIVGNTTYANGVGPISAIGAGCALANNAP